MKAPAEVMLAQYEWYKRVFGGYTPTYTDAVNRQQRHCRIGRIKPTPKAWAQINGGNA